MQRIGIYGGTFNPPHIGHIRAVQQAAEQLKLDRLILMPDRIAPHKQLPEGSADADQRYEMVKLASSGIFNCEVSDMELRRDGVSYTYLTVLQLRKNYPDAELFLIMGTDMFLSFHTWREPETIAANCTLAVMCRGEQGESDRIAEQKALLEARGMKIRTVRNDVIPISSTDLRRMLVFGCAGPFLPGGVREYIQAKGLYGTDRNYRSLSMAELEQAVVGLLKPSRIPHVLGCRDTAVKLADRYGADPVDAARAGLLHDITKALDGPLQLTLCREYGIMLDEFSEKNPKILHALTGSLVAERIFGENPAVVAAIRHHTTGKAEMTLLEKIIYVADYMEPNRDFPGVEVLRDLAYTDIDKALKLGLEMTLAHLKEQGSTVSRESREALAWLNR